MDKYAIKPNKSIALNAETLMKSGVNLKALGQTSTKNRPYMVVAVNGQMTWLAPLTTVLKGKHGRIEVTNKQNNQRVVSCEVVTTDMFSIATEIVATHGRDHGWIIGAQDVREQIMFSVSSGTLGRYKNA